MLNRVVAEAHGNPLALLELPRALTPAQLAGGFGLPDVAPLANRIEQSFLRRLESLPDDTRRLLLTAAAEPVGDTTLLWRAADGLGLGADAAGPAQTAGLIDFGALVRFRHPLVRSAVYQAAPVPDRREVHLALAEATDPEADPDRRAWHRAHAASGLDEPLADELERSAGRAQARGGIAAAAAFLERAAELTPDSARRGRRALAAAQAKFESGAHGGRAGAPGGCGGVPTGRASARAAHPPARRDRVRAQARQRRSASASRCSQAARATRQRIGARGVPGSARSRDLRRPPQWPRRPA